MIKLLQKTLLTLIFFAMPIWTSAVEQSVVAVVGSQAITDVDLAKRMRLVARTNNMPDISSNRSMKLHILKMLIDEQLISARANELKIKVDELDLKEAKNNIAARNSLSIMQLDKHLTGMGIEVSELEKQITHQLLWSKIISAQIEPQISVSDLEIKNYNLALPAEKPSPVKKKKIASNEKFQLAEIEISFENEAGKKEARATANRIYHQLQQHSSDFAKLANDLSQGSNASKGGMIGWFKTNQLSPLYRKALDGKTKGYITKPLESAESIVILKIVDHVMPKAEEAAPAVVAETPAEPMKDADAIKNIIWQQKLDVAVKAYLRKMHDQTYVNIKL